MQHNEPPESTSIFENEPAETPAPPPRRGFTKIAWLVILLVVGFVTYRQNRPDDAPHHLEETGQAPEEVITLLQGRNLVGLNEFSPAQGQQILSQAQQLNQGTIEQRLRFIVLANELANADRALEFLDDLNQRIADNDVELTDQQSQLRAAITAVLNAYAEENWDLADINPQQRTLLVDKLGWFGRLLLAPAEGEDQQAREAVLYPAERSLTAVFGVLGLVCLLGLAGGIGLVVLGVLCVTGDIRSGVTCGRINYAGIYAETFAIWLMLFLALTAAVAYVPIDGFRIALVAAAMFSSLSALVWPRLRGISFRDIRRDIGWTAGRNPLLEPLLGLGCYAMTIPILFLGFLATLVLIIIVGAEQVGGGPNDFSPSGVPSHPIISLVPDADWLVVAQLYLVAAVAAPVVEETVFRGVLYRQLRELSHRLGFLLSFLFAAGINSVIFAIVHPQGWLAVPALSAMALGLTIAREWRGTLIPSMVAHGIHNGLLVTVLVLALSN